MTPLPPTMKAPGDIRLNQTSPPWRGATIQIAITRACDLSCTGCTQGSNLVARAHMMRPDQFATACRSLLAYEGGREFPGVVGVFGGNPCIHPQFPEICKIMQGLIPWEQRGLWTNNLNGHGKLVRRTFNAGVSNLNVHTSQAAYDEMVRDWPEAAAGIKGLSPDSRHTPSWVAMKDMEDLTDEDRWRLISTCDVNQHWSSIICVVRGELRTFFCELAGSQAMVHESESDYPDTGHPCTPGWWDKPMAAFDAQVRKHCFDCGHPLRGFGDYAVTGTTEYTSKSNEHIFRLKRPIGKTIKVVTTTAELGEKVVDSTKYLQGVNC